MNPIFTSVKFFNDPQNGLIPKTFPLAVGEALASVSPGTEIDQKLCSIPTEVGIRELRLMFHFANALCTGQHSILEIGPLFGGTTRALAMGLLYNTQRKASSKVYTYDQFCTYYKKERHIEKLRDFNALTPEIEREVMDGPEYPEFRNLFDLLHSSSDYYKLLDINTRSLPDRPEHINQMKLPIFTPPEGEIFEYVMVDACKSWFSTKYFMTQVLPQTPPGTIYHFQDYAWFSCFWLPVFTTVFKEYFDLVTFVDTSYIFRLKKELPVERVREQFPDSPTQFNADTFEAIFDLKIAEAIETSDFFGLTFFTLQKAAALAYIGEKDKSKHIICEVKQQPYAAPWIKHVDGAMVSPTYHPPLEPSGPSQKVFL